MGENNEKTGKTSFIIPEILKDSQEMIINNLQKIQGVDSITINQDRARAQHRIEITFDPTIASRGQFLNLIEQLGQSIEK